MSNQDGYQSAGLIERIDLAVNDITLDLDELAGRKVAYEDGKKLIDALFYCKQDIEEAITQLDRVLSEDAVCN